MSNNFSLSCCNVLFAIEILVDGNDKLKLVRHSGLEFEGHLVQYFNTSYWLDLLIERYSHEDSTFKDPCSFTDRSLLSFTCLGHLWWWWWRRHRRCRWWRR